MTREEADKALMTGARVIVRRNGSAWTGCIVGIVDRPCVILKRDDGKTHAVVLDGATLETKDGPDA